jgi:hypothetical protein
MGSLGKILFAEKIKCENPERADRGKMVGYILQKQGKLDSEVDFIEIAKYL